jgi:hypothetical protein
MAFPTIGNSMELTSACRLDALLRQGGQVMGQKLQPRTLQRLARYARSTARQVRDADIALALRGFAEDLERMLPAHRPLPNPKADPLR